MTDKSFYSVDGDNDGSDGDEDTFVAFEGNAKRAKKLIHAWLHEMTLDPAKLNVGIKYRVPEGMYMNED